MVRVGRAFRGPVGRVARVAESKPLQPSAQDTTTCRACGRSVATEASYVVRIDVFADPSMPPIHSDQPPGEGEVGETADDLIQQLSTMSDEELQDQVHRRFEYRVCAACQKLVLANPLGLPRYRVREPSRN